MLFVQQLGVALFLVTITLWLHCWGDRHANNLGTTGCGRRYSQTWADRSAALVVRVTTAMIAVHGSEVLLWACSYRWLCFSSWESALYFSASSYATVGYGDVVLTSNWRMLGPLESMIGVLMCGLSASLLFAIAPRLVGSER
jgi:voltage-gated potassium channel